MENYSWPGNVRELENMMRRMVVLGSEQAVLEEIAQMLAGHAATAIFASRVYAQSERKLSTIQGFIDLLTK